MTGRRRAPAWRSYWSELPIWLNLPLAALPMKEIAAMHTTAINATSRAYSTSEAPRSVFVRAVSHALMNSKLIIVPPVLCR